MIWLKITLIPPVAPKKHSGVMSSRTSEDAMEHNALNTPNRRSQPEGTPTHWVELLFRALGIQQGALLTQVKIANHFEFSCQLNFTPFKL